MNSERRHARLPGEWIWLLLVLAILLLPSTGAFAVTSDQRFATPEDAATALVAAVKSGDGKAIRKVLGDSGPDLSSGDPVADRKAGNS